MRRQEVARAQAEGRSTITSLRFTPHARLPGPPGLRWLIRHEGLPMRGAAAGRLPAAVREVSEAHCYTAAGPQFWEALGCRRAYVLLKKGNEYRCVHAGHLLRVCARARGAAAHCGTACCRGDGL